MQRIPDLRHTMCVVLGHEGERNPVVVSQPVSAAIGIGAMSIHDLISKMLAKVRANVTQIEHRADLSKSEMVQSVTHIGCAICAGVAVQPIPFADIFVLTPIQAYIASRIAAIRGVPLSEDGAKEWIKQILGIVGLGFLAQQAAIGIWKLVSMWFSFGIGAMLTVPMVYGLSYAIFRIADVWFDHRARGASLSDADVRRLWREAFREGRSRGKNHKPDVGEP